MSEELNTTEEVDETTEVELVFYEAPPVKDVVIQSVIGAGIGLAVTGVVFGAISLVGYGVGKVQDKLADRRRAKFLKEVEEQLIPEPPTMDEEEN